MSPSYLAGLVGLGIIALFLVCTVYLYLNREGLSYAQETLSLIASYPRYTNTARALCWTVCILIFPFIYGLIEFFDLEMLSYTSLIGLASAVTLFFTAVSLSKPGGIFHIAISISYFGLLLALPLEIAIKLINSGQSFFGFGIIATILFTGLLIGFMLLKNRGKANGIMEVLAMTSGGLPVLLFSILMLR